MDTNKDGVVDREEYLLGARRELDAHGQEDASFRKDVYAFVKGIFDTVDVNGDGLLNAREVEFGDFLAMEAKYVGGSGDGIDYGTDRARRMHTEADLDQDFYIDRAEFGRAWQKFAGEWGWYAGSVQDTPEVTRDMAQLFDVADIDADGRLSWRELQYAGFLVGDLLVQETAFLLFLQLDADADGVIELEEVLGSDNHIARLVEKDFRAVDTNDSGSLEWREGMEYARHILQARPKRS